MLLPMSKVTDICVINTQFTNEAVQEDIYKSIKQEITSLQADIKNDKNCNTGSTRDSEFTNQHKFKCHLIAWLEYFRDTLYNVDICIRCLRMLLFSFQKCKLYKNKVVSETCL